MPFPSPPWRMQGQLWLSLLRVPGGGPGRPPGTYGVALVDYQPGSVLTYGELLVARPVRIREPAGQAGRHVTVTDIWVDSPASRDGGRSLWAVPKELAGFTWGRVGTGAVPATDCVVRDDRGPIASAAFGVPRLVPPRLPFSGTTWQPRDDGSSVLASLSGSARSFPVRARWSFAPDGPLGWLAGRTPFASFVLHDFRMTFG